MLDLNYWNRFYIENRKWNRQTNNLPKVLKNKKVLELGVGNGKTLKAIIKQKPKSIVALDFSREAIKICKEEFKDKNIKFIVADIKNLPLKDSEFEVVICYYILNCLRNNDLKVAINEIQRVLKPNGILIFEDFYEGDMRQLTHRSYHFFKKKEVKKIFNKFSKIKIMQKTYLPFAKSKSKRKIIRVYAKKLALNSQ